MRQLNSMNLVSQLLESARRNDFGSNTALRWANGSWTYGELFDRIQYHSTRLGQMGIETGDRVVFRCSDSAAFVAVYLAAVNIGAVAVAVSTRFGKEDLERVIEESKAVAMVVDSTDEVPFERLHNENSPEFRLMMGLGELDTEPEGPVPMHTVPRSNADECLWVYSSGSTGHPKGIVHTHRDMSACCGFHCNALGVRRGDTVFCTSRLTFAYALANGLLIPLMLGATVYLHPEWVTPSDVWRIIANESPTVVFSVPSIYSKLLQQTDSHGPNRLSDVTHYVSAGEHLPSQIQDAWSRRFGKKIINVYGCSETLFLALAGNADNTPSESVGQPLPGVNSILVDRDKQHKMVFELGVLHISHPFMFQRYANREQETSAKLAGGVFATGDLYRCDSSGNWFHQGREDDLIKVSGQWVNLRDVEKVGRESGIAEDIVVVGASDHSGMIRPALFFIPANKMTHHDASGQMRHYLEQRLVRFKQPSWIRTVEDFPRTVNGKISRGALQDLVDGKRRDAI